MKRIAALLLLAAAIAGAQPPPETTVCSLVAARYPFELYDAAHWRDLCKTNPSDSVMLAALNDPLARVVENVEERSLVIYERVGTSTVGYIRLSGFWGGPELVHEFDAALEQASADEGLIVDLRGASGGSVETAFRVFGRFTQQTLGGLHLQTRMQDLIQQHTARIEPRGDWQFQAPLVILVDGFSQWPVQAVVRAAENASHWTTVGYPLPPIRGAEVELLPLSEERWLELPTALAQSMHYEPLVGEVVEPGVDLNDETLRKNRRAYRADEVLERGLDELHRMIGRMDWLDKEFRKQQNETKIRRRERK